MSNPWYPKYPGDYLRDTRGLTLEEHGAYNLLLDVYYSTGEPLPPLKECWRLCYAMTPSEQKSVEKVLTKYFTLLPDGHWQQKRAEIELSKQQQKAEKRIEKAKKAAEARWGNDATSNAPSMPQALLVASSKQCLEMLQPDPHPQPHPGSKKSLKPSCPKPEPILDDEAVRLSKLLAEGILKNNPNNVTLNNGKRDRTVKTWAKDIDKLHRIDGQKYPDIEKVIRWTQRDEFWSKNILSAGKLRKQWDQLWIKVNDPSRKKIHGTPERLN